MIKVEGLTKRYARTLAVDNVSFEVGKGQIVGFLGPNGAGKTTTMRVLTCFLPPSGGRAEVAGYDVTQSPMEVKRRIGYLPETPPLYPEMEVEEYLYFVGRLKGVEKSGLKARVAEVAERCNVADVRHLFPNHKGWVNPTHMLAALDLARLGDVLHRADDTRPLVEHLDEQAAGLSHAAQHLTHYGWADDEP